MDPYWAFFAVVIAFPWLRYVVIRMEENYELEREALRKAFQETKQEPQPTPGNHSWEQPPWNPNLETEPGIERGDDSNQEATHRDVLTGGPAHEQAAAERPQSKKKAPKKRKPRAFSEEERVRYLIKQFKRAARG